MVLSIYDNEDFSEFYNIQPIRKINNDLNGYDLVTFGTRLGIGFVKNGVLIDKPSFDLDVKGAIRCLDFTMISDARKKENIKVVSNSSCLDMLSEMNVYNYNLIDDKDKNLKFGFIAQEIEKVGADLVKDVGGVKSIDTMQLLAIVCGAVKQLIKRIDVLEEKNEVRGSMNNVNDIYDEISA